MTTILETTAEPVLARARVEWALVPKVNLLPPEILAARRFGAPSRSWPPWSAAPCWWLPG